MRDGFVRSWRRDVTGGRPDGGRSARRPVSRKRLIRRSVIGKFLFPVMGAGGGGGYLPMNLNN